MLLFGCEEGRKGFNATITSLVIHKYSSCTILASNCQLENAVIGWLVKNSDLQSASPAYLPPETGGGNVSRTILSQYVYIAALEGSQGRQSHHRHHWGKRPAVEDGAALTGHAPAWPPCLPLIGCCSSHVDARTNERFVFWCRGRWHLHLRCRTGSTVQHRPLAAAATVSEEKYTHLCLFHQWICVLEASRIPLEIPELIAVA